MSDTDSNSGFSAFLPIVLLSIALLTSLTWSLSQAVRQQMTGQRVAEQLEQQKLQAADMENKLRLMMADLVILAQDDKGADAIVKKFKIAFTPATSPQTSPQAPASTE